ncbi:MAG: hypothetical protein U0531_11545 [Dehalococcoidia bacterium]
MTTNLRIECGDINGVFVGLNPIPATNLILPTIQKNTCNGVQVGVAGNGVGISELNARYEPAGLRGGGRHLRGRGEGVRGLRGPADVA